MNHVLASAGDFAGAAQAGLRALTIATSLGDAAIQMWTSVGLGRVYFIQGDYRRAIACTREVIDALAHVSLDERFLRINVLPAVACRTWLALSLGRIGEFDEALAWSGEAARIAEELDGQRERVWAGQALAFLHLARGDAEEATAVLEPMVTACREGRFPIYTPFVTASLGAAYAMTGRGDAALSLVEEGVAGAGAIKQVFGYSTILIQAAAAHLEAGRLADAEHHASTALELRRRTAGAATRR